MTDQAAAWVVILMAALGASALAFVALRRWPRLRWLGASLVLAWTATPFSVADGHIAPAFAVFVFRRFLEDAANPRPPLALLLLVTVLVVVIHAVAGLVAWRRGLRRGAWRNG